MSGNTNNTVFIQRLFTSRDNFTDGNVTEATANALAFVGDEGRIWWDPDRNAFYSSDGNTPGGFLIGGSSGNGEVYGSNTWVQYNNDGNFGGVPTFTFDSSTTLLTAPYFAGDGSNLSNINGSNITGSITNATHANVADLANSVAGANVSGTVANANYAAYAGNVTIAAQSNITSVGILGNLVVSGNANANIVNANYLYGDGSNISNLTLTGYAAGNTTEIQFNDSGNFAGCANFTFDKTSNTMTVDVVALPIGTILQGSAQVSPVIANLDLRTVIDYSTGPSDTLPVGSYGNPDGVTPPWTVYQMATTPTPSLLVNDLVSGAGVVANSFVQWAGLYSDAANANIVVTSETYTPPLIPPPSDGTNMIITRSVTNAGFSITTTNDTDIVLNPGNNGGTTGSIVVAGNIVPLTDGFYNLGTPNNRFHTMYVGGRSIYIYDSVLGTDQSISAINGNLVIDGGAGLTVGEWIFHENTMKIANIDKDVIIGSELATGNVQFNRPIKVISTGHNTTFEVTRSGRVKISVPNVPANDPGALIINSSTDGNYAPINNPGGMVHIIGPDGDVGTPGQTGASAKLNIDAYGTSINSGVLINARRARGNVNDPSPVGNNDVLMRLAGTGWASNNYNDAVPLGFAGIDMVTTQEFAAHAFGSVVNIYSVPNNSNTRTLAASFTGNGIYLSNSFTGVTFQDNTFQNTAFNDTSAVTSVTVGVGLSQTATVGDVGIDATGVTTVAGTANQVYVNGNVSGGISNAAVTLTLPQNIDSGATLSFANLTITGTLNANNFTTAGNSVVHDKILNLAYDSTSSAQIDGGGIILGNISDPYTVSILYDLPNNSWNTDGAGLYTLDFTAANANIDYLYVKYSGHFGVINKTVDYPNAYIQIDSNTNSYSQIVSQNHSPGTAASSDLVLVNDIGNDGNHFLDLGINGSNYVDPAFSSTLANDGYLFVNQGNLVIGTDTPGQVVNFVAGGTTRDDIIVTISNTGISTPGNVSANYFIGNGSQLTGLVTPVNANWTSTSGLSQILNKTGASGPTVIALGQNAAGNVQGSGAIAIGISAAGSANTSQGADSIAIGTNAGGALDKAQGDASIAIGKNAGGAGYGTDGQQLWSIAIGNEAGNVNQAAYSVALGAHAGRYNQGTYATALGQAAGLQSQGQGAVAIGAAGYESQGAYAVAIGSGAGDTMQGNNAIAIGYQAGGDHQTANSIILNASGAPLETLGVAGLFINPVRNNLTSNANIVFFNTSTKELTYANTISLAGNANVGNLGTNRVIATGNISGTQLISNIATGTAPLVVTSTTQVANLNVATAGLATFATTANSVAGANVSGPVSYAAVANSVAGANVSGTVANATYAVTSGTANSVAGANVSGTVANATYAVTSGTANSVAGANVSGTVANANYAAYAGNVTIAGQSNITSVGTLTGLTSNGIVNFTNTSNVTLGAVGNLHITGGNANDILQTNGSGNLSWANVSSVNGVGGNQLVFVLNAQQSIGSAKNTLLSLFGLANGVTLATNTRYQYEILFNAQCSKAGTLSYALALGSGTAVAQHNYNVISNKTTAIDAYSAGITMMSQNATGAAITTAQIVADTATFTHTIIQGTIDVTTGGNVNFKVSQDQNTPVTWTINAGSYVKLMPLGAIGANTAAGTWS